MSSSFIHQPAGIYIHVPFCRKKCAYCDFYSLTDQSLIDAYVTALKKEAAMVLSEKAMAVDTIYFGGGTPSVLNLNQITEIISLINLLSNIYTDSEITVEVNPESAGREWLKAVREAGVNRVSIGIQSFDDNALAFLGRIHSAGRGLEAVAAARSAGFDNIGLDIIYGLPGQTRTDLEADLSRAIALAPEHISCYLLTMETGTPLEGALRRKAFVPLSDARQSDLFLAAAEVLTANGYLHYEISNFACRPETRSRHNTKYWQRVPYAGLGPAAHSYTGSVRYWNVRDVSDYVERLSADRSPRQADELLTARQKMMESLYLGLRLAEGLEIDAFNREFSTDFQILFAPVLAEHRSTGMLEMAQGRCRLSTRGMLFHETIAAELAGLLE
ncbi:MAG: radical SAM family heme chaperone HemW [Thermodesulfobacteriota bacterium]